MGRPIRPRGGFIQRNDVLRAWGRILTGYPPALSIEITTRCPLSCPGCYAYQPEHVAGAPLESLTDLRGDELVEGILELVDRHRPLIVYLVGGEPLVRHRELDSILPEIEKRGIAAEVVTSAVRPIPLNWSEFEKLQIVVSIDGLQPEHDARRKPATYDRILRHIEGHRVAVHCTVTNQMAGRSGYLETFARYWSDVAAVRSIRFSLFTPQVGETGDENLTDAARRQTVAELGRLSPLFPKLQITPSMLKAYLAPPDNPTNCTFARVTRPVSADLETIVTPCVLGGNPNCAECGCVASVALSAVSDHRLPGGLRCGTIFEASDQVGVGMRRLREGFGKLRSPR